jgi:3-oxoacyl-[acyl-carrier protein] reductase
MSGGDLDGRVALVTGAGRNIGRQIALALGARGAAVLVHVGSDEAAGRSVVNEIVSSGGWAVTARADLASPDEVRRMVTAAADELGSFDILVNCAAVRPHRAFVDISDEDWRHVFAVNLDGPFYCCRAVVPGMIAAKRGSIVNISGTAAWDGRPSETAHISASKAGLHGLTKALAVELGEHGIRVNTVVLSTIETVRAAPPAERVPVPEIPLRRLGRVDEVANVVAFLASDAASYITGQAIHVNGGSLIA